MADVLLINMWFSDLGRYGASNYGLLKVIFEVNLKLFEQAASKKLLFVLRDYDPDIDFNTVSEMLQQDVDKIWGEIYKPEKFANSKPTDFFQFEFINFPSYKFQKKEFVEKTEELKQRLVVGSENALFLDDSEQKNLPIDGLHVFIEKSWEVIRNQKDLNLPD